MRATADLLAPALRVERSDRRIGSYSPVLSAAARRDTIRVFAGPLFPAPLKEA